MSKYQEISMILKAAAMEATAGVKEFPSAVRSPLLLRRWLWDYGRIRTALAVAVILSPFVFVPIADWFLGIIFPSTTEKILFGLIKDTNQHPWLEPAMAFARIVIWAWASIASLILLFGMLPGALRRFQEEGGDVSVSATAMPRSSVYDSDRTVISSSGSQSVSTHAHRYVTGEMLGHGAMGVVFKAHDSTLERDVALKELPANLTHVPELVTRFRQEAKVLARLTHPAIVHVYDLIEDSGRFWMVIELVEGEDLSKLLKKKGNLSVKQAASLSRTIAEGMAFAHSQDVVHRDLKPSNILMTPDGRPKITDFGLAKLAESNEMTQAGTVLGSPAYMSPEQALGKSADKRSDIYSLGIMIYQMITGEVPFKGEDMAAVLSMHINETPAPLTSKKARVPKALEKVVLSMLEKNPDKRIQSMDEAAKALLKFC